MQLFTPLKHRAYRRLFTAQVAALLGTGLATVALGLLAHDLAGANAGEVLGIVLGIKMIAYVGVAPFASALVSNLPRKALLVTLDVIRALVAASLPFVSEPWQVYGLMAVLYVSAAAFTPAFQAMIPDLLPDEREYTEALSLSRLAADLESVASPVLAALLLSFITWNGLFGGTALGFVVSALFVVSAAVPAMKATTTRPFIERLTGGLRLFALTPRLRGVLAFSLASSAGGAMVFVNTVVLVQSGFSLGEQATAWALAAFGLGSMTTALALPKVLDRVPDRTVVAIGGVVMTAVLLAGALIATRYPILLGLWLIMGAGYGMTLVPIGRVLRRSSTAEDRPALFAAHFALSHACWLIAYPVAGLVSASVNPGAAFLVLAALCAVGLLGGLVLWPRRDPEAVTHTHDALKPDDPHLIEHPLEGGAHTHAYVIDGRHHRWPER
jgi:MFS family permease